MELFNDSLPFDKRLGRGLAGSKLTLLPHEAGVIDQDQSTKMRQGLGRAQGVADGSFVEIEGDEDIHTANERRLSDLVGTTSRASCTRAVLVAR